MSDLNETRRRFMTYFAGAGLGSTLAPGIVWARMQDAGTTTITLEMITEAMKLSGIALTEAERMVCLYHQTACPRSPDALFHHGGTETRRGCSSAGRRSKYRQRWRIAERTLSDHDLRVSVPPW